MSDWQQLSQAWFERLQRGATRRDRVGRRLIVFGCAAGLGVLHVAIGWIGWLLALIGLLLTRAPLFRSPAILAGGLMLVSNAVSTLLNGGSLGDLSSFSIRWIVIYVAALGFMLPNARRWGLRLMLFGLLAAVVLGLMQYFIGFDRTVRPFHLAAGAHRFVRVSGFFSHPIYYAVTLGLTCVGALTYPLRRWIQIAVLVACLIGLVLSGSRGAILALAAGLAVSLLFLKPRKALAGLTATAALVGALGLVYAVQHPETMKQLARFENPRFLIWNVTGRLIAQRPLFGHAERYQERYQELAPSIVPERWWDIDYVVFISHNAHNDYLENLVNYGAVGLLLTLILYAGLFRAHWRLAGPRAAEIRTHAALLGALAVASLFQTTLLDDETCYQMNALTGLLIGTTLSRLGEQRLSRRDEPPPP